MTYNPGFKMGGIDSDDTLFFSTGDTGHLWRRSGEKTDLRDGKEWMRETKRSRDAGARRTADAPT
jgi:hypothetical protein